MTNKKFGNYNFIEIMFDLKKTRDYMEVSCLVEGFYTDCLIRIGRKEGRTQIASQLVPSHRLLPKERRTEDKIKEIRKCLPLYGNNFCLVRRVVLDKALLVLEHENTYREDPEFFFASCSPDPVS